MAKPASEYGFVYVFHLPLPAFHKLTGHFTGLEMTVTEEREDIQIVHFYDHKRKLLEDATYMFELWTGHVHKSRNTDRSDIEIVLAMDDKLKGIDHASAFGALRYSVMNHIRWKREQCERMYEECYKYGFKLPPVPNSARSTWEGVETPTLAALLLDEVNAYLDMARSKKEMLCDRNKNETLRDLGRVLRVRKSITHTHS